MRGREYDTHDNPVSPVEAARICGGTIRVERVGRVRTYHSYVVADETGKLRRLGSEATLPRARTLLDPQYGRDENGRTISDRWPSSH